MPVLELVCGGCAARWTLAEGHIAPAVVLWRRVLATHSSCPRCQATLELSVAATAAA